MKPTRIRTFREEPVAVRRRGLTNSSMPKLMRESAVPSRAMHRPTGTNHHQAPWARAWLDCAQKSTVPQFQWEMSATPMKARVISESTAKMTVPTNPDAMTAVRFGMTSNRMIRQVDSPVARAAST